MANGIVQRRLSRNATRTKATARITHPAKIANHVPERNQSKATAATKGPTLSAAASEGRQNHHTNPSGVKAQTQGKYQKLGVPSSNANVKHIPPIVNSMPAAIREMVSADTM